MEQLPLTRAAVMCWWTDLPYGGGGGGGVSGWNNVDGGDGGS